MASGKSPNLTFFDHGDDVRREKSPFIVPDMDIYWYFSNLVIWQKKAFRFFLSALPKSTNNESGTEIDGKNGTHSHDIDQPNWQILKIWKKKSVNTVFQTMYDNWENRRRSKTKQWNENISNQFLFNRFPMKCVKKIMEADKSRTKESLHAQFIIT